MIYTNSENEKIQISTVTAGRFEGQRLLVLHDDPPPHGSGKTAMMLLDAGTVDWLAEQLADLKIDDQHGQEVE